MSLPTEGQWARYSALCARLRPLPLPERDAALQALRATGEEDPQVLSLVAFHFALPPDPVRDRTGERLGNFTLEAPLGQGGMGVVYRAQQHLGAATRPVAMKLMHPTILLTPREEALVRFLTELHTLGTLQHESIVRIYDGGIYEDPHTHEQLPYIAMELVHGGLPITTYAQDYALSWQERLTLFVHVCQAVRYAHEHRVVHRDLKPTNILVDHEGHPFVIDFGLASACDALLLGAHLAASGTPAYMSPEQVSDVWGAVSNKSDVYALGLILYELLTHQHPYALPRDGSVEQLRQVITEATPLPLSQYDKAYSGEMEEIMAAPLAKRPANRITVAVLRSRLARYLQKLPPARAGVAENGGISSSGTGEQIVKRSARPVRVSHVPMDAESAGARERQAPTMARSVSRRAVLAAVVALLLVAGGAIRGWYVSQRSTSPPRVVHPMQFALWDAVIAGNVEGALAALKAGADINGLAIRLHTARPNGRRSLNYAAYRNDPAMITALLGAGAAINGTNLSGFTPLHHASEAGATEAAGLLIARGASLTLKNRHGQTPLETAESHRHPETATVIRRAMTQSKAVLPKNS